MKTKNNDNEKSDNTPQSNFYFWLGEDAEGITTIEMVDKDGFDERIAEEERKVDMWRSVELNDDDETGKDPNRVDVI